MYRLVSRTVGLGLALTGVAGLSACNIHIFDDDDDGVQNTRFEAFRTFHFDVPAQSRTRVRVEGINGNIAIVGDPTATSIVVTGERVVGSNSVADAEAHLPDLEVRVTELSDEVRVRTIQPSNTGGRRYEVRYEITLPLDFEAVVTHINGNVEITDVAGGADVQHVNGNVLLFDLSCSAEVDLVNGSIDATIDMPLHGIVDLAITNGNIALRVPTDVSAELFASVSNGLITLTNLTLHDQSGTSRTVRGTLGAGDGTIELTSVNGNIALIGM